MKELDDLIATLRVLRGPHGCPWDKAQKITDYKRFLLEEVYELIEGIDTRNPALIQEELGDVYMILTILAEMTAGKTGVSQALSGINAKLIHRHPHVFSSIQLKTKEEVLSYWVRHKAKKKKRKTIKEKLPLSAPAMLMAEIFWREYFAIHPAAGKVKPLPPIAALLEKAPRAHGLQLRKTALIALLMDICRMASLYKIDLEPALRAHVLKKSAREKYPRQAAQPPKKILKTT